MVNKDPYSFNIDATGQDIQKFLDDYPDETNLDIIEFNNSMHYILKHFPILEIDPKLDESINYTNHFIEDFKMPYPAFFINKPFKTEAGVIAGIYVYDLLEILKLLLEEAIKDNKNEYNYIEYLKQKVTTEESLKEQPNYNVLNNIIIGCLIVRNGNKITGRKDSIYSLLNYSESELNHKLSTRKLPELGLSKHELQSLIKDKIKYAVGIANLITTNVDLDNPQNPNKDVRIIPRYLNGRDRSKRTDTRSVIRVFGKMRKDLEQFNNEIRRRGPNNVDAYIVRGHWRHFRSDRFKNKQGETIWIMPFVRGNGRELVSRVVGIKE